MKFTPSTIIDAPSYGVDFFDGTFDVDKCVILRDLDLESDSATMNTSLASLAPSTNILDLTNNSLTVLPNLRNHKSLHTLLLARNRIRTIDGRLLPSNLNNLVLSNNGITTLDQVNGLQHAPKTITNLSLRGNQICHLEGYRTYILTLLPSLQILDFTKITQDERNAVKDGTIKLKQVSHQLQADSKAISEDKSLELMQHVVHKMTDERKKELKLQLINATSLEEIDRLEKLLAGGI
ncbi:hypothetical protein TBLA_0A06120 [Henningerozyma blattae CBS 6284]|uniref:U2 small nuclear ribonucleoprotein A' n=1 Tax=Henningerozyma blattae (strain ATCC 34711 / CBS 6284 / DSM 70876 / NBRC 10599 / NRRL Y-10934 / UCD 77-7) TaxID=1071380 RepID=I2GWA3_HENB6|nr:hypothetical protein TBLA_0A06120 [Tetrapisispora blattae CBS 6284]CCH58405.1 hypothetical protein TBLA_0A06120 [Tetrapisispora blattae CBS 6284]